RRTAARTSSPLTSGRAASLCMDTILPGPRRSLSSRSSVGGHGRVAQVGLEPGHDPEKAHRPAVLPNRLDSRARDPQPGLFDEAQVLLGGGAGAAVAPSSLR